MNYSQVKQIKAKVNNKFELYEANGYPDSCYDMNLVTKVKKLNPDKVKKLKEIYEENLSAIENFYKGHSHDITVTESLELECEQGINDLTTDQVMPYLIKLFIESYGLNQKAAEYIRSVNNRRSKQATTDLPKIQSAINISGPTGPKI